MTRRSSGGATADWLGRLYDRHGAGLYRYALMILADPASAADVVHDVFVALLEGRNAAIEETERYLRRAVRNRCYDALRRRRHAPVDAGPLIEIAGADCDPTLRLAVEQSLAELPPEQREVVHLKMFERMTFQEIADATGESINTIASRHRYAMEKLRLRLRPQHRGQ